MPTDGLKKPAFFSLTPGLHKAVPVKMLASRERVNLLYSVTSQPDDLCRLMLYEAGTLVRLGTISFEVAMYCANEDWVAAEQDIDSLQV